MYGSEGGAAAAGGILASTGLAAGSWLLMGIGLIFAGAAIIELCRRKPKHQP